MRCAKLFVFVMAASLAGGLVLGQQRLNMAALKQDTRIFRGIVQTVLREHFTHPFALEVEPQATYLQGYGIVVTFDLYINRPDVPSPFDIYRSRDQQPSQQSKSPTKSKEEQVELVRSSMISCLAEYGGAFKQLSAHDRIAISAHIEDRNELDQARKETTLVISATKDDIDLFKIRRINAEQFQERVNVLMY